MKSNSPLQFQHLFRKNFRMTLLLLGLPLLVLMTLFTALLVHQHLSEEQHREEKAFSQALSSLNNTFEQTMKIAANVGNNNNVQILRCIELGENNYTKLNAITKIQSYISALLSNFEQIDDLYVLMRLNDDHENYLVHNHSAYHYQEDDWLISINTLAAAQRQSYRLNNLILENDMETGFHQFYDQLYYLHRIDGDKKFYVVLRLNNAVLRSNVNSYIGSSRMLVARDGVVLFDTEKNTLGSSVSSVMDASSQPFTGKTSFGWDCYYLFDMQQTREYILQLVVVCAVVTLCILLLSILLCEKISRNLIRPYETILELLSNPDSGASEHYAEKYAAQDELGLIYTLVHQSAYQNLLLQNELSEREKALTQAQNIALRSQISPHFLFNTLEAINWSLFEKLPQEREIPKMLQKLALLFRMNLEVQENLVPLSREIIYAQAYLDLQEMRFRGQYDVVWQVEENAKECLVICMCLQPILENAISHGVTKMKAHGRVIIRAHTDADNLFLQVEDNGPGIDPAKLQKLQESLKDSRYASSDHIGLINVNARIQLLNGLDYGLTVTSVPYESTSITMKVPRMPDARRRNEKG